MKLARLLCILACLMLPATAALAQSGKISGRVLEASSGEALPGVNVSIEGTTQGSVSDVDGYYFIVNVRPGTYTLRASFIGFTSAVVENVRVATGLTTEIDFSLQEEAVGLDEVVVTSERPVVQRDVSASVANISAAEIENLPVTDIEQVIGLQAGFERGLTVRGFGGDQVQFMVDGLSMTSGRGNDPFTGVSYTSVQEVQVQTGGFNAEYGNVRSGLINVITKEPERNRFFADAIIRYSPEGQKNFAGFDIDGNEVDLASSNRSFWLRPMTDPEVAMAGTSAWPTWKQNEFFAFPGWNSLADNYNAINGTSLTPQQVQQTFFDHYLRKDLSVQGPDYEVDATIGGPVPGLNQLLGDLRFVGSYRQTRTAYEYGGEVREGYMERIGQGKLISNFAPGMKLVVQGLYGKQIGLNSSQQGDPNLATGESFAYPWAGGNQSMYNQVGDIGQFFTNISFQPFNIDRFMVGAQFTHTLSPSTFYEVQLQSIGTQYDQYHIGDRNELDSTFSYLGGQIKLTEEPFGYTFKDRADAFGVGMRTAGHWSSGYDNSEVQRFSGRFDVTSQLNRFSLMKAGVEYIYSDYNTDYGENDPEHPHNGDPKWNWHRKPTQAAAYIQNKLEFKGMVANVGLRLDYFHAGGDWYVYSDFDRAFSAVFGLDLIDESLEQEPTERQVALSPRLGVSFPVTDNSKLYFNYGHFRTMLNPQSIFNLQEDFTGAVRGLGNPNHPMPKTVMYELGYEQNLFNQYLLRLAGYYRDLSDQPRGVTFVSVDDLVNYSVSQPWNYGDVRGFEVTISRNRGRWIQGFVNYTYMVRKTGNFGFGTFDENRTAQIDYVTNTTEHYTSKPIPEPYARFNISILLPTDLGPEVGGGHPLGDWRISFLGEWREGQAYTWNGLSLGAASGGNNDRKLQGNVRWKDYYMLDMRLGKNFATRVGNAQFFVDFTNVLNIRHMYISGNIFNDGNSDQQRYMQSLQLPEDVFPEDSGADYPRIYGDDKPGDYRNGGVAFVPILIGALPESGDAQPLYYVQEEGKYYEWNGSAFVDADQGRVNQVLDDKAYINMPNRTFSTFLNPRNVFIGLRLSF